MSRPRKLGILVSVSPEHPNFNHAIGLAGAALDTGCLVYLYCIDDAVRGVAGPELQRLRDRGLKLFACAYGAQRRSLTFHAEAIQAGLTVVRDLIRGTDRFVSFN